MATVLIPLGNPSALGNFYFNIALDGVTFQLFFKYNQREDFYYVDILDLEGTPIRSGIKIVVNYPLLKRCVLLESPAGELLAVDTSARPQDPGKDSFGKDQFLLYEQEASVPE